MEFESRFEGSIPEIYDRLLVPMIFRDAARALADVVAALGPSSVLETAAGTGVLTRELLSKCAGATVTSTDLNQPMLDRAAAENPSTRASWQQADALDLPFGDDSFDVVACQFGVMFFPERSKAFSEAARVLRSDGSLVFNVWDRIENNEIACAIEAALTAADPDRPSLFMSRTPHGYHDQDQIDADLERGGMKLTSIEAVEGICRTTAHDAAFAFCAGSPLSLEITTESSMSVPEATEVAEAALIRLYGEGPISGRIRSFQITAHPAT